MSLNKNTIILLASNGNNIGKTTTANLLAEHLKEHVNVHVMSFAEPIKQQVSLLYATCISSNSEIDSFSSVYTREDKNTQFQDLFFKSNLAFAPKLREMTPRLLVNQYSDMIQELISPNVWANAAYLSILNKLHDNGKPDVYIFDDFRREIEYSFLKEELKCFDIITVYLDKEGLKDQVSTSYEGQLKDFNFTLRFTFNQNYYNFDSFLKLFV